MSEYRPTTSDISDDSQGSESFHIARLFEVDEEEENSDNLYETPRVVSPSRRVIQPVISINNMLPPHELHYILIDTDDDEIEEVTDTEESESEPVETLEQSQVIEATEAGYAAPNKSLDLLNEDLHLDWLFCEQPASEIPGIVNNTELDNMFDDLSEEDDNKSEELALVFVSDIDEPHSNSPTTSHVPPQGEGKLSKLSQDSKAYDEYGLQGLFKKDSTDEDDSIESNPLVSIRVTSYPSDNDDEFNVGKPKCSNEGDPLVDPSIDNDDKPQSDTEDAGFLYTAYDIDPAECGHFAIPLHHSDEQADCERELAQDLSKTVEAQEDADDEGEGPDAQARRPVSYDPTT